jgi:aspartokinase
VICLAAGFLANVFDVFRSQQVSVDVVASSEVSISLSLDPKKSWSDGEVRLLQLRLSVICYRSLLLMMMMGPGRQHWLREGDAIIQC